VCIADEPGIKYMPDPYDAAAELAAEKRWHVLFSLKNSRKLESGFRSQFFFSFSLAFGEPSFRFSALDFA
jgi:hypothetical protein